MPSERMQELEEEFGTTYTDRILEGADEVRVALAEGGEKNCDQD